MRFKVQAYTDAPYVRHEGPSSFSSIPGGSTLSELATTIWQVSASAEFETKADAQAFVAAAPKALKLRASELSVGYGVVKGYISAQFQFSADGVNKGFNETGLKRLRRLLTVLDWDYAETAGNSATPEQFSAFVATGRL